MRRVLRASAIMGASSVGVLACTVAKNKVLALRLGPEGVGLVGGLNAILTSAALLGGLGLQSSLVRQVARAREAGDARALARLWWQAPLTAGLGGLLTQLGLTLGAATLARRALGSAAYADVVAWLAPAAVLSVLASVFIGWMNGYRRTERLARTHVAAAAASAVVSIAAVLVWPDARGALVNVVSYPACQVVIAWLGARADAPAVTVAAAGPPTWRPLVVLGVSTMAASVASQLTQLQTRGLIADQLGLAAAGQFQAAWNVSMLYLGFVLSAMGTDYYPHLTESLSDRARFRRVIDEQIYAALLLAVPVILAMALTAPLVLRVLYSGRFGDAVEILRWQLAGDLLKVPSWALGYVLLAQGRSVAFVVTEVLWNALYLGLVWVGLPRLGLAATGVAFLVAYAVYLGLVAALAGWRPSARIAALFPLAVGALAVFVPVWDAPAILAAKAVAALLVTAFALYHLRRGLRRS